MTILISSYRMVVISSAVKSVAQQLLSVLCWCVSLLSRKWGACFFLHGSRPCVCTFSVALALLIPIGPFLCNCQNSKVTTITAKYGVCASRWSKYGETSNGIDKTHDTVGNRAGGSGRHQLAATEPTYCWSSWQSLGSDPHYGISGKISPAVVAMFCESKLARQGVGGGRDLPRWAQRLFWKHCPRWQQIEICRDQTSSGWGPHGGRQAKCHHFAGQWSIHRQLWRWWSICWQVRRAHGDSDAAEKLGGPDPLRLAQLLRSKRHCRIFGTQLMGPRGSGRNGWDSLRLWF